MDGAPRLGSRRVRRFPAPTYLLIFSPQGAGSPLSLLLLSSGTQSSSRDSSSIG